LWTIATTSFIARSIESRGARVNASVLEIARCTMPAPNPRRVQESNPVSSAGPSRDPRATLPTAISAVAEASNLDGALRAIIEAGAEALEATSGAVVLADPDRPGLQLAASVGIDAAGASALAADLEDAGHPFASVVETRVATFDREALATDGASSVSAYVPLVASIGGVESGLGALGLTWPGPRELTDDERDVLVALAALAAIVIDRARLASTAAERSEWFERMAHTDALTGIANERTVGRVLELELARAGRQGGEVSLALFDIDDFRSANERDGRDVGDDILRRVAAVMAESVRLVDTVGRIGGDEFVLVAPGSAGAMVARRVQEGIAALPVVAGRSVSVSVGIARFPADGGDTETLIAAATEALSRAKESGAGSVAGAEASV
jgi:diguanylate cyclase (GGDEF)-like protein